MSADRTCPKCSKPLPADAPQGICPACLFKAALDQSATDSAATSLHVDNSTAAINPEAGVRLQYFGDYELLEEIARGGMGVVWKAKQSSLNRPVALKMIRAGALASADEVQRFRREAEAAANLQHPNIVAIHEVGAHGGQHYFSMDYVAGRDLGSLAKDGPLAPIVAARYVKIIAEAIHFAHQRGTLHRDLKPQNVLIDADDQPRITDFGLAKLMSDDSALTQTGVVMGSPSYMPPEQAAGRHADVGPASDVYSLGAMLYELLTGRPPFRGATPLATLREVMEAEPTPPRQVNPSVPIDLETICLKCLEKGPAARYATARALAEELDRFMKGEPIQARPAGTVRKIVGWTRRRPGLLAGIAALAIVTLAFGVYYLFEENAFLRAQQIDPTLLRIKGERHANLDMWIGVNAFGMLAGIYAFIFVGARARGLSFRDMFDPAKHDARPTQPLGDRMRSVAVCIGLLCLGIAVLLLVKLIQAHVWEGEPILGKAFQIYGSAYFGVAALLMVARDYQLAQYGLPSRHLAAEQLEGMRRALEDYDLPGAIRLYRETFPDASFVEANQYVMRLMETLRAQHPGKFMPPPLSLTNLNWGALAICAAIEAVVFALWCAVMPLEQPLATGVQFAFAYLLGAGIMAGTRVKGYLKRMLLVVPAFVVLVGGEIIARQTTSEHSQHSVAYMLGIIAGVVLMVSAFTRRRSR